jgi:hypothetical protein
VFSYLDDIVVASKKKASYISDVAESFANMHEAKLQLDPEKCIFRLTRGKVLGCLVSTKGIEAKPNKIKAMLQMQPPQTKKKGAKNNESYSSSEQVHCKASKKKSPLF